MTILEWQNIFRDNLSEMLEERGMTQCDLAEDSGLAVSTINNYMTNRATPSVKAIVNIAYTLDVPIDELLDFGDRIE